MVDLPSVTVEAGRLAVLASVTGYLVYRGRSHQLRERSGWGWIVAGFGLWTLLALFDLTDEFAVTHWDPVWYGIEARDVLEELVLPVAAALALGVGLVRWLDLPATLSHKEAELRETKATLEDRVAEATESVTEVNEELRAEREELASSTAMFEAFADSVDEVFWIVEGEGERTLFVNEAWSRLHGRPLEDAYEDPMCWLEQVHEDDLDDVLAWIESGPDEHPTQTFRLRHPTDGIRHVAAEAHRLEAPDGEGAWYVGTSRDVTAEHEAQRRLEETTGKLREINEELRASQARFEALASTVEENLWVLSGETYLPEYISPAFETIFGMPHDELEEEAAWFDLVHPEDRERVQEEMLHALDGERSADLTYRIERPDGAVRWVETSVRPDRGPDGEVSRFVGVTRDITDRVEAEKAREEAIRRKAEIERLEQLDQYKTQFLNTAAHELSTPITPVKFQLEALESGMYGELTDEQQEALDLVGRNLRRLQRLIEDLLDASRLEADALSIELAPVDLVEVVEDTVESLRPQIEGASIELEVATPDELEAQVDAGRVEQVLANLLSNAVKFTPEGGRITVRLTEADDRALLTVEDTGAGLDADHLDRLFEPFYQENRVEADGTGLGLTIARGMVEAHGGTLSVTSEGPGHGATFTAELPLSPDRSGAASAASEEEAETNGA